MNPRLLLLALSLAVSSARAADFLPAPIVETFDSLTNALPANWTQDPTTWTSSVSVVSADSAEPLAPVVWTAANARRDFLSDPANPALGLQAASGKKGWLSATIPVSCQRLSFSRMNKSKGTNAFDVYVNTVCVASNVRMADTNGLWQFERETIDPDTGLPFEAPISILVSNRIVGANLAIDDLTVAPYTLFVTLDRPATNSVTVQSEEFTTVEKEFNVVATHNLPPDTPSNAVVTGFWTVTPSFSGGISDLESPHLTLVPSADDVGKTFTLSYTATITVPPDPAVPSNSVDSVVSAVSADSPAPPASFSHTASCTLSVSLAPVPRFLDFEDVKTLNYNTNGGTLVSISGGNFVARNFRKSTSKEPAIGTVSLCGQYQSNAPAFLASDFAYPNGIGTVSFRYANYSTTAVHRTMAFVAQVRGEEDDDWTDLPDGTLVVTNHYDISDCEFRVNADMEANTAFRLLATAGYAGSIGVIDNLHIRPFGSNAPVLLFRGSSSLPVSQPWSASFHYANPAPDTPYAWSWSVDPDLPGLVCTTNDIDNRLEFSATADPALVSSHVLTVAVSTNGTVDQRLSVPLAVAANPSFDLVPRYAPCTNVVVVRTTNVVLYGTGTNYSVAWTAEPPFNGTNSVHNKSEYRVKNIVQSETTEHLLTAVLTDDKLKLSATNTLLVTVLPSDGSDTGDPDDPSPVDPSTPSVVIAFSADSLTISNLVPGASYTPFTLTNLLDFAPVPVGPPTPASDSTLTLPLTNLPASSPLFLGVFHSSSP